MPDTPKVTVYGVFSLAVLVPSPPILVPELVGAGSVDFRGPEAAAQVEAVRAAALEAAGVLAATTRHWTVLGIGGATGPLGPEAVGTFRGFGVDVRVAFSEKALSGPAIEDAQQPLPALIAGWLRGRVAPTATATATLLAADTAVADCAEKGEKLRRSLDTLPEPQGVLVVADGAATLSTAAPGYFDPRSADVQAELDRALATGDAAGLLALDPALCGELGISGRAAFQVLAGLFAADPTAPQVETLYSAAPFGVGYQVSLWRPGAEAKNE